MIGLVAAAALGALYAGASETTNPPAPPLISSGESIARRHCAECHALTGDAASALPDAPAFPQLRQRHDRAAMAQIVAERMVVIHPRMPKLQLEEDEVEEFLDYWDALRLSPPAHGRPYR